MQQPLNLRQIEAFKAVIEQGTVSQAALALGISQPAVSKLIAHLEADTRLHLFDRVRGKLITTTHGARLYQEIDRIFSGLRQVEQAVETIRRDEQRTLNVGVLPALSGPFIRRSAMNFLKKHPDVRLSVQSSSSYRLAERLITGQYDVVLVGRNYMDNPYIDSEPLFHYPLHCAMSVNHELTRKRVIRPRDLVDQPFISFGSDSLTHQLVKTAFDQAGLTLNVVLSTNTAPLAREFVAAGLGVTLIHPLDAGMQHEIVLRRFEPKLNFHFQLCRAQSSRNAGLVETFVDEARSVAAQMFRELLKDR